MTIALLFDIDDTLVTHKQAEFEGAQQFFLKNYMRLRSKEMKDFLNDWSTQSLVFIDQFLKGHISFTEQRRCRIREVWESSLTDEEADKMFHEYLFYYEGSWRLFDDVLDTLIALKQREISMGVVSNGSSDQQRRKLKKMGIEQFFDTVVISEEIKVSKPERAIFELAASQMNQNLSNCFYIGDNFEADILGAFWSGIHPIWINRKQLQAQSMESVSFTEVKSLLEILDLDLAHS